MLPVISAVRGVALSSAVLLFGCAGFVACSPQGDEAQDGSGGGTPQSSAAGLSSRFAPDLPEIVNQTLGLRSSEVATLTVAGTPAAGITMQVLLGSDSAELVLNQHSVRAPGYTVLAQLADGSYEEVTPGEVRTLRGHVAGVPDSRVAATLEEDGLYARVLLPDGQEYWVEPVARKVTGAADSHYAIYRNEDIIQPQKTCGATADMLRREISESSLNLRHAQGIGACGTGLCQAQVAADADFEYYQFWGSVAGVENRINNVINTTNIQYERDVDITHLITTIIVRTADSDPYTSTDPSTLLNQFRTHWLNNHGDIQRDIAQLFTGRDLNSTTIGIAWLSGVCNSLGFSVVQSDFTSNFGCVTDLSAHEFGHNWGADHCICSGYTMNPSITCANQFHPTYDVPDIASYRDSQSCLTGVVSGCAVDADCDDGDDCTGLETCSSGICQGGTPLNCNDSNACTTDTCAPSTGSCSHVAVNCTDNNPCTSDDCNPGSGCTHAGLPDCCGNDVCELGEDCDTCSADCISGGGPGCGNGVCEPANGEDCLSCSSDCNGRQAGPPSQRFCCGDGAGQGPVGCGDSRCTMGAFECGTPPVTFCCGDGSCQGGESSANCPIDCGPAPVCGDGACTGTESRCNCASDCGAPPSTETSCTDVVDNDCDGQVDCADSNRSGNAACPSCGPAGAPCSSNSECCSNKCKGNGICR